MSFIETLNLSKTAMVVLSCAIILFAGFAMTRLTKLVKLPNVTAYIIVGILLSKNVLNVIPSFFISGTDFLSDIALAFISFATGEFFKLDVIKKSGLKVILISLISSIVVMSLTFVICFLVLKLELYFSLILASLAGATAPASTMMTIRQTNAKGNFVNILLLVIVFVNIISLFAYSIAISLGKSHYTGESATLWSVLKPILTNILAMIIGGILGFVLKLLTPSKRTVDNRLIIAVGILFVFCGICSVLDESPFLGCMAMGMAYINVSDDNKLFKQLAYFSPPIMLLFFVRSGLNFDLGALTSGGSFGSVSLLVISIIFFVIRAITKWGGSYVACLPTKEEKSTKLCLGLGLMPLAGVAIPMATYVSRIFSSIGMNDYGLALESVIVASSILYEILGPAVVNIALYKTKSYSTNIEDVTTGPVLDEQGQPLSEVDILISRIKEIEKTNPPHEDVEEEAFNEGAIEYASMNSLRQRNKKWRK